MTHAHSASSTDEGRLRPVDPARSLWGWVAVAGLLGVAGVSWFAWSDRENREAFETAQTTLASFRVVEDDIVREGTSAASGPRWNRETGTVEGRHLGEWSVCLRRTSAQEPMWEAVFSKGDATRFVDSFTNLKAFDEWGELVMDAETVGSGGERRIGRRGLVRDRAGHWVTLRRRPWWED